MSFKGITVMVPEENPGNITAADDAAIFQSLIGSDGVLNIGSNFSTTVISNNDVRVSDGVLCVGGHIGRITYGDYNDMTIENGILGENRNDIIYAKFLTSGNYDTFTLEVKKGDSVAGTAKDPDFTQGILYENATLREIPLWRVKLEELSIVAVEQMFTVIPTIPELEAKYNELNSNLKNMFHEINVTCAVTTSTVFSKFTTISVTIPANSFYCVQAELDWSNSQPAAVGITNPFNDQYALVARDTSENDNSSLVATISGYTKSNITLYPYGKSVATGTNSLRMHGFYVTI